MKALMDTHTFLWWTLDDPQLSPLCRQIISDTSNTIYLSAASAWEIAIKFQKGKLPLPETPERFIVSRIALYKLKPLPITIRHTLQVAALAAHHNDPFDRILIVQSQIENLPILTLDSLIAQYPVQTLW
jgi:PIN domain nuclease of toxin-antitoxin system